MPRVGASFSRHRAAAAGLEWRTAFARLLDLGVDPLRVSVHWSHAARSGLDDVDWQLDEAARAGRSVLLTVGMKAQGWPEFSIPPDLMPDAGRGRDVTAGPGGQRLLRAAVAFVAGVVDRYRSAAAVVAWQVENEPLNPSGPMRWWLSPDAVAAEIAAVRGLDPGRPICVNVFAGFNAALDVASSRHGLARLTWQRGRAPEAEALALLAPGDILGLDVYRRIGSRHAFGLRHLSTARAWERNAARWRARAAASGRLAWVTEAQAEPWEPPGGRSSCRPEDVGAILGGLRRGGYDTVLLWGAEHWLAEEAAGRPGWIEAVRAAVQQAAGDGAPTPS